MDTGIEGPSVRDFRPRTFTNMWLWWVVFTTAAVVLGLYAFGGAPAGAETFVTLLFVVFATLALVTFIGRFVHSPAP